MSELALTPDEILALLEEQFPQLGPLGLQIEHLDAERVVVVLPTDERHLRPGGTISGPTMMMMADTAMYFAVLAHRGRVPLAVTTSLNINFLRKPAPGDLWAEAAVLKMGSRLAVGEVTLTVGGRRASAGDVVAHATVTYSVPPS